jgi:hypothetical protein
MHFRRLTIVALFAILCLIAPVASAQDGIRGALSQSAEWGAFNPASGLELVAADFDNDQKPDGAVLIGGEHSKGRRAFRIEIHLTGARNASIPFFSSETWLEIEAVDVNRDGLTDIVVEKAFSHERVKIYLNHGHGRFTKARRKAFPAPKNSKLFLRARFFAQLAPYAFLQSKCSFGKAEKESVASTDDVTRVNHWANAGLTQAVNRMNSASRAPPSLLRS